MKLADSAIDIDRVHLGDCMEFMRRMPDKCVPMTLTDIPYDECNKESAGLRQIDKAGADLLTFDLIEFVKQVKRVTSGSIYIFCGIQQISRIYTELHADLATRLCHWQKTNPSPMNGQHMWLSATENCLFAKFPGAPFYEHCHPNVWQFPNGSASWHPTQKPIGLFKSLIEASSNEGDTIFDPCMGSGTTGVAAIAARRHFVGVELNAEWHRKCVRRIRAEIDSDMECLQRGS